MLLSLDITVHPDKFDFPFSANQYIIYGNPEWDYYNILITLADETNLTIAQIEYIRINSSIILAHSITN